jgi:hypothetical protein
MRIEAQTAISGYFTLVVAVSVVGRLMGGGFGLDAFLNGALALVVFGALFLWLMAHVRMPDGPRLQIERSVRPHVVVLCLMILSGVAVGTVAGNAPLYLVSTTIYWLNVLLFTLYVSTLDCGRTDLLRVGKGFAALFALFAVAGIGPDIAIANMLICLAVIFALGERRIGWALLCILPFVLNFGGLNRAGLVTLAVCVALGAVIYRRWLVLGVFMAAVAGIVASFTALEVGALADPGTSLHRRLIELQTLMTGTRALDEITALAQRLYEIRLVNQAMADAGPLQQLLGAGFGRTVDMTASQDDAVLSSATIGAAHVHNIHSLPHALYLRNGALGLVFLALVLLTSLFHVLRAMMLAAPAPFTVFCVLFPLATLVTATPASNHFLTEFIVLALIAQAGLMLRRAPVRPATTPRLQWRPRLVWRA